MSSLALGDYCSHKCKMYFNSSLNKLFRKEGCGIQDFIRLHPGGGRPKAKAQRATPVDSHQGPRQNSLVNFVYCMLIFCKNIKLKLLNTLVPLVVGKKALHSKRMLEDNVPLRKHSSEINQ